MIAQENTNLMYAELKPSDEIVSSREMNQAVFIAFVYLFKQIKKNKKIRNLVYSGIFLPKLDMGHIIAQKSNTVKGSFQKTSIESANQLSMIVHPLANKKLSLKNITIFLFQLTFLDELRKYLIGNSNRIIKLDILEKYTKNCLTISNRDFFLFLALHGVSYSICKLIISRLNGKNSNPLAEDIATYIPVTAIDMALVNELSERNKKLVFQERSTAFKLLEKPLFFFRNHKILILSSITMLCLLYYYRKEIINLLQFNKNSTQKIVENVTPFNEENFLFYQNFIKKFLELNTVKNFFIKEFKINDYDFFIQEICKIENIKLIFKNIPDVSIFNKDIFALFETDGFQEYIKKLFSSEYFQTNLKEKVKKLINNFIDKNGKG